MPGKVKTYIEGFDDRMSGGIPRNSVVLFCGEPGTMKSSLCYSILYNNALEKGLSGAYITLEQGRDSLLEHMENFGLPLAPVQEKVSIVDLGLIRKNMDKLGQETWMQIFKMYTKNLKESMGFDILVIDSLPVLEMLAELKIPRNELFHLFEWLKEMDTTIFVITEMEPGSVLYAKHGADFLSDGIIHVKMEQTDDINVQRRIRCVKMRNTPHSTNFYTLLFNEGVFEVTRVLTDSKY